MNNVHFAIPEIYGETLSYYELLRKIVTKMNELVENYNTIPDQIAEEVKKLDASQLFSTVLNQLIHSIATDNTKSSNAVKVYKKHDLLYATFNETVNLYESMIDFSTGTATELIQGTNIREVNISELLIDLRKLIDNEAQDREQADQGLQTNIENEAQAREQADQGLQTNIENETQAREQADHVLQTNIDNEINTLRTMLSSPYNFKGEVASISALPASGEVNDTYYVKDVKYKVTWNGSAWVQSSLSEADYETELSELKDNLDELEYKTIKIYKSFGELPIHNKVDLSRQYSDWAVKSELPAGQYKIKYVKDTNEGFQLWYSDQSGQRQEIGTYGNGVLSGEITFTLKNSVKGIALTNTQPYLTNPMIVMTDTYLPSEYSLLRLNESILVDSFILNHSGKTTNFDVYNNEYISINVEGSNIDYDIYEVVNGAINLVGKHFNDDYSFNVLNENSNIRIYNNVDSDCTFSIYVNETYKGHILRTSSNINKINRISNIALHNSISSVNAINSSEKYVNVRPMLIKPEDFSGNNLSDKVRNANDFILKSNGNCVLYFGDNKEYVINEAIILPSNTKVVINDCRVRLKDLTHDNIFRTANLIPNKSDRNAICTCTEKLHDISIIGYGNAEISGPINRYKAPAPNTTSPIVEWEGDLFGWRGLGIIFEAVDNFDISGFKFSDGITWSIYLHGSSNGSVHDIVFKTRRQNGDGVDIANGCNRINVYNIGGFCSDDAVALCAMDEQREHPGIGQFPYLPVTPLAYNDYTFGADIHDITIDNIDTEGDTGHQLIFLAGYNKIYNIHASKLKDHGDGTNVKYGIVRFYGNTYFPVFVDGNYHDIFINDVECNISPSAVILEVGAKDSIINKISSTNGAVLVDEKNVIDYNELNFIVQNLLN